MKTMRLAKYTPTNRREGRRVLTVDQLSRLVSKAWKSKLTAVEAVREERDKPAYR